MNGWAIAVFCLIGGGAWEICGIYRPVSSATQSRRAVNTFNQAIFSSLNSKYFRSRTITWNPTALCDSSKTDTCCLVQKPKTPGKLGRAVGFWTGASRLGWIWNFTVTSLCRILAYCRFSCNSSSLPIKPELGGSQIAPNRKCNLCFSAKSIFAVWDKK